MDKFNYRVINPRGDPVLSSNTACRYPLETELQMINDGYRIALEGRRLTATDIRAELRKKACKPGNREVRKK